jgi:hypothetical protein
MPVADRAWAFKREQVVSSAVRTTSSDSGTLSGYGPAQSIRAQLNVTAASGTTPTLDVVIEDTLDGTNWNVVGTFAQKTAVGREVINVTALFSDTVRIRWTIGGGTASFTFAVDWISQTGEA